MTAIVTLSFSGLPSLTLIETWNGSCSAVNREWRSSVDKPSTDITTGTCSLNIMYPGAWFHPSSILYLMYYLFLDQSNIMHTSLLLVMMLGVILQFSPKSVWQVQRHMWWFLKYFGVISSYRYKLHILYNNQWTNVLLYWQGIMTTCYCSFHPWNILVVAHFIISINFLLLISSSARNSNPQ